MWLSFYFMYILSYKREIGLMKDHLHSCSIKSGSFLHNFFILSGEILHVFVDKYSEPYTRKYQLQLVNIWAKQRI